VACGGRLWFSQRDRTPLRVISELPDDSLQILQLWHAPFPTSRDVAYNQHALARITGPKFGPH